MIFKRCFFVVFFFVLMMMSKTCFAQIHHLLFEMITVKEGLPANKVTCIAKDSLGFFWYGTTLGLVRHDGTNFDVFKHNPNDYTSVPADEINSISVDRNNLVIVGTMTGLVFAYNYKKSGPNQIVRFPIKDESGNVFFAAVIVDGGEDHIYIWNKSGTLCKLNKSSGQYTFSNNGIETFDKTRMYQPFTSLKLGGNIWLGSVNGLFRFDLDSQCMERIDLSPVSERVGVDMSVGTIAMFDDESIVFGSKKNLETSFKGIVRYNFKQKKIEKLRANIMDKFHLEDIVQQVIYKCQDNVFLLIPYGKGPVYYNFETCHSDTLPILENQIGRLTTISNHCFYKEQNGKLMIGSNQGIFIHEPFSYVFEEVFPYLKQKKYPNRLASSYYDERCNQLVIAAPKLIRVFDYAKDSVVAELKLPCVQPHHLRAQEPELIRLSSDKLLVLGSHLSIFDLTSLTLVSIEDESTTNHLPNIQSNFFPYLYFNENTIYFVRDGVFYKLNTQTFEMHLLPIYDESGCEIFLDASAIAKDKNNAIWISSYNHGLIHIHDITNIKAKIIANKNIYFEINDIHIDRDDTIWMASKHHGLLKCYVNKSGVLVKQHFNISNGFNTNTINQISEDKYGKLWMQTNYGVSSFEKSNNHISNFAKQHGINFPHNLFRGKSKDWDGNIYLSEGIGIIKISPEKFKQNFDKPNVFIKKFSIYNKAVQSFWQDTVIQLNWDQKAFSFEISAVNHTHAHMNSYKYILENYHNNWITTNKNDLIIAFNNLKPGKYVFRAIAANHVGIWNDKGINIVIQVNPPFWKTWWFVLSYLSAGAYFVYWYIRFRVKQLRKQELLLIEKEIVTQAEERKRIAKDLHDDIGAQLSTLKMYIDILNRDISQQKDVTQFSKETQQLIGRTIEDMRHIITELSPQALELYGYFAAVKELIYRIRKVSDIHIILELDTSLTFPKSQETALFRITQELFNNTLKHADATEIHFGIHMTPEGIVMDYKDNGKGFDLQNTPSGRGLYNINSRVKMLHGKVHQQSKIGHGTKYQIIF